ncbi:unnamed protein product, partial [Coregonus sp. 'balchen']
KKLTPSYDIRAAGNKNRHKFLCEVHIEGFNYTGMGNSTNKKDAQANAARDFVNYLVRAGEMNAAEVPTLGRMYLLDQSQVSLVWDIREVVVEAIILEVVETAMRRGIVGPI